MISDLLGNDRIRYELDEIVYGVNGWMYTLETLDLLADGQRIVGERRRVAVIVWWTAVHCWVTLRAHHTGRAYDGDIAGNFAQRQKRNGRDGKSARNRITPPCEGPQNEHGYTVVSVCGSEAKTHEQNSLRIIAVQNDPAPLRTHDATKRSAAMWIVRKKQPQTCWVNV